MLCRRESSRLLIVDIQTRLMAAMPDGDRTRVIANAARLVQAANLLSVPVTVSEQYPQGLGHTEPTLAAHLAVDAARLAKTCFSLCDADDFDPGTPQAILAGVEAHVCVLQTAVTLQARGIQTFVVADAISARDPANTANALSRLSQAGVVVTNTESVLFEWLRDARDAQFKAVTALIK
jgi:isochorismate hydrolase